MWYLISLTPATFRTDAKERVFQVALLSNPAVKDHRHTA
jgi:hypothetical protein